MILFISVTKKTMKRASQIYLGLSLVLGLFAYIYEQFSYGEHSLYMRGAFVFPLIGALVCYLSMRRSVWVTNRISYLLFNSAVAVFVSGCLVKGIIDISGRTTTLEQAYWIVATGLLALSFLSGLLKRPTV